MASFLGKPVGLVHLKGGDWAFLGCFGIRIGAGSMCFLIKFGLFGLVFFSVLIGQVKAV